MRVVFAGEIAQPERQRRDAVEQIARERLERVSRMYRTNKETERIEPEGTRSQHNAEPAQNLAKPEQNQALTALVSPVQHKPESTSLHFRDTNKTLPSAQKLYGTTNPAHQPMLDDLARVVAAWPSLSDDQKAQILAVVGRGIA